VEAQSRLAMLAAHYNRAVLGGRVDVRSIVVAMFYVPLNEMLLLSMPDEVMTEKVGSAPSGSGETARNDHSALRADPASAFSVSLQSETRLVAFRSESNDACEHAADAHGIHADWHYTKLFGRTHGALNAYCFGDCTYDEKDFLFTSSARCKRARRSRDRSPFAVR
jgi:hypothetical protein